MKITDFKKFVELTKTGVNYKDVFSPTPINEQFIEYAEQHGISISVRKRGKRHYTVNFTKD